ncbi:sulfatase domain-containing protein [Phthorimaea operculella]|nr:sulfatase domain-containing protein [Phthorimaea operculella]
MFVHVERIPFPVLSKLDESVGAVVSALQAAGLLRRSIILFTSDNGGPAAGFNDNAASNYPLRGVSSTSSSSVEAGRVAVLSKLDESVGAVVSALQAAGLLRRSIILFTSDNGGPAAGFNDNAASNYPLRGVSSTSSSSVEAGRVAVLSKLDESVGAVVSALQAAGLLRRSIILFTSDNGGPAAGFNDNAASNYPLRGAAGLLRRSIILFTSDNGGPAAGFNDNAASNYPLRGVKNTLWEGGVRGAALLWSPLLDKRSRVSTQLVHLVDWLPTLYTAAGGNASDLGNNLDGFSLWESLSKDLPSPRAAAPTLLNIDDVWGNAGLLVGEWKLLIGTNYNGKWDEWYGPAGREVPYDAERVMSSSAARAIQQIGLMPSRDTLLRLRSEATVSCDPGPVAVPCFPLKAPCLFNLAQDPCERRNLADTLVLQLSLPPGLKRRSEATVTCDPAPIAVPCFPLKAPCLFNLAQDPCERRNLADTHPDKLQELLSVLSAFNRTAVPASRSVLDPAGDPARWGRVYTNFRDYRPPPALCAYATPRAGDESTPTSATTARRPRCVPSATPRAGDESTPTSATTARRPRCVPSATPRAGDESTPTSATTARRPRCVPSATPRAGDESTPTSATTARRPRCVPSATPRAGDESTPTSATTARRPRCVPSATPRAGDESTPTSATTARRPRCVPSATPRAGDESTPTSATTARRPRCVPSATPRAGDESTPTSATTARRPRCVPSATPRAGDESTPTSATTARRPRCVPSATPRAGDESTPTSATTARRPRCV